MCRSALLSGLRFKLVTGNVASVAGFSGTSSPRPVDRVRHSYTYTCGAICFTHVPTFFSLTDRAQCTDMCNTKFLDARRRCGIIMITIGVPILGDPDARQEWPSPGNSTITKLLPSTVGLIGTYSVGQLPNRMAFDGTNLWVTRAGNNVASIPGH